MRVHSQMLMLTLMAGFSNSARILGILPTPSISHQLPFRLIALELARRGHEVTFITTDPIRKNIENYKEIDVSITYNYWWTEFDFTAMSELNPTEILSLLPEFGKRICEIQLESPQLKDFFKSQPAFDVIILERLFYYCYHGLALKLGSPPLIGFTSMASPSPIHTAYGNPNNPAYIPEYLLGYSNHMSFWERLYNAYVVARLQYMWHYEIMPLQEDISRKYFGDGSPPVHEVGRNYSLLITNNHFSMNYPRPMLPNVIEVTGLHIEKERKPLSMGIKRFLDGAENGVIYFSLGSNVNGSAMSEEKRRAFLEAFAQLPQRVLWKWEVDSLPGQPENVMISKWLPQQDVLAHPNIRLFITQGGLQSMNEAGYFAVPLVGIPFIADQQQNVVKMVQAGVGYSLPFKDVTKDSVLTAVCTVLGDTSYRENMKRFSAVFRDHQETSLDRAVWWIEYVIRHKGAPHLRSAALDLHWWQLLLLDVFAFVAGVVVVAVYLMCKAVQCMKTLLRYSSKEKRL